MDWKVQPVSWLEDEAIERAILYRDGPEVWRDIKASIRQVAEDYTRFYSPPGTVELQYTACTQTTDNCVRVRIVPAPGIKDTSFEITLNPDSWKIQCDGLKAVVFSLTVAELPNGNIVGIVDGDGRLVTAEDVSKAFVQPLIDKLPPRPPNILVQAVARRN
jgi:hypothetical protein